MGIATAAVVLISVGSGHVPWLGLALAVTFGTYGLIKKTVPLSSTASLTAEGVVLGLPAAALLVVLQVAGVGTLTGHGAGHVALLMSAGPVTALPLLLYGAAARRIPLTTLGTLMSPDTDPAFLWGVLVVGEAMPPGALGRLRHGVACAGGVHRRPRALALAAHRRRARPGPRTALRGSRPAPSTPTLAVAKVPTRGREGADSRRRTWRLAEASGCAAGSDGGHDGSITTGTGAARISFAARDPRNTRASGPAADDPMASSSSRCQSMLPTDSTQPEPVPMTHGTAPSMIPSATAGAVPRRPGRPTSRAPSPRP